MTAHFNELSEAEAERLAILAEECAEVIQVVGKILRHGYESFNPHDPDGRINKRLLETEIGDLFCIVRMMTVQGDVLASLIEARSSFKTSKFDNGKGPYLHHQQIGKDSPDA